MAGHPGVEFDADAGCGGEDGAAPGAEGSSSDGKGEACPGGNCAVGVPAAEPLPGVDGQAPSLTAPGIWAGGEDCGGAVCAEAAEGICPQSIAGGVLEGEGLASGVGIMPGTEGGFSE